MNNLKLLLAAAGASVLLAVCGSTASAAPITATEIIKDPEPFDAFNSDLIRRRTTSEGLDIVTTDEAAIIAENAVSSSFGIFDLTDVSYTHRVDWVAPPAGTYLSARLKIYAFNPFFDDDSVIVDSIELGDLTSGLLSFTTTVFQTTNPVLLSAFLADGKLNVFIDKNETDDTCGFFLDFDGCNFVSIWKSKLTVTYKPAAVPEPGSLLLLGSGMLGLGSLALRRRRAPSRA